MKLMKSGLVCAALALGITGCGDSDDGGDDPANKPGTGAIPSDFTNKAGTKTEFSNKMAAVKSDIVDNAASGLGMSGASLKPLLALSGLVQDDGGFPFDEPADDDGSDDSADDSTDDSTDDSSDDSDDSDTSEDWGAFTKDLAEGGDCGETFKSLEGYFDQYAGQISQFDSQTKSLGDDFSAKGMESVYTVTDLKAQDGGKYAFHYKMTKKEDQSNPALSMLPDLEIAGGASETAVAMKMEMSMTIDPSAMGGGDAGGDAGGTSSSGKMTMVSGYELYADTEKKSLDISFKMDGSITENNQEKAFKNNGKVGIVAGDLPAMTMEMEFSGMDEDNGGKDVSGKMKFGLAKKSADAIEMSWDGNMAGTDYKQTITLAKTATGCTVTGVEK